MDIDLNDTINKLDLIIMYRMLNLQIAKYTSFQGHTKLLQKKKKKTIRFAMKQVSTNFKDRNHLEYYFNKSDII